MYAKDYVQLREDNNYKLYDWYKLYSNNKMRLKMLSTTKKKTDVKIASLFDILGLYRTFVRFAKSKV